MRAIRMIPLLLLALLLGGCGVGDAVENQAYALVMGIDRLEGGALELTVRLPRIGPSKSGDDSGKEGEYLLVSANGDDWDMALEALQWATPRELNLSQLKLLAISSELAGEPGFPELTRRVAATHHLYTAARLVVCEGSAKGFVTGQEVIMGARLSSEITAMFDHYAEHGYIPDATFADLCYTGMSIYSDPVAIWGFPSDASAEEAKAAAALIRPERDLATRVETPAERNYLGAALFREGRCVGRLDARETLYYNLVAGRSRAFSYGYDGGSCTLTQTRGPRKSVQIDETGVRICLMLSYATIDPLTPDQTEAMEADLAEGIRTLISKCQEMEVEPFGFAQKAARRFLTIPEWLAFDWRARFAAAEIDVRVEVQSTVA